MKRNIKMEILGKFVVVISLICGCCAESFNEAYAASVVSQIDSLISVPWLRVNNILFSAFNSKWEYLYDDDDGALDDGRLIKYVHTNNTIEYLWSMFKVSY
mmetsp:Transcript_18681/g.22191  ORF Transcript_18681/g.22191 Transcript_18681/m.22191 type:complete len:101 (+) Transcript_18681:57-359(+)